MSALFHIVLYQPEIPPNTGNIIRLCANTNTQLHLIHPFGFQLDNKKLRRAGLDYREFADVLEYNSYSEYLDKAKPNRIYALTTKAHRNYSNVQYRPGDAFIFGPETRGLPDQILERFSDQTRLRVPMVEHSRSLNLSNSAAVVLYEAWRQQGFDGARPHFSPD